jgi:hypothetical protein
VTEAKKSRFCERINAHAISEHAGTGDSLVQHRNRGAAGLDQTLCQPWGVAKNCPFAIEDPIHDESKVHKAGRLKIGAVEDGADHIGPASTMASLYLELAIRFLL